MQKETIYITAMSSISSLGDDCDKAWQAYHANNHCFVKEEVGSKLHWVSKLDQKIHHNIAQLRQSNSKYKNLDNSVLYAIYAARKAVLDAGWSSATNFGINIGSSRGATSLFEKHHSRFLNEESVATSASPTTTLGNISSWVAHDLQSQGPVISHSITCSTALHALLNGIAWIQSGMSNKFLVGGSEAPLTPFTLAQMRALKIYATSKDAWPCRALDLEKNENTMVLGEAASMACLEKEDNNNALAEIVGFGYATEPLKHGASLSTDAMCFQKSMQMALNDVSLDKVDGIVMHAPGTIKGDMSEYTAIKILFEDKMPLLTTNKWKVGHTFGASGMLSIEMAVLMLKHQKFIASPFYQQSQQGHLKYILVNAVGFGGNAVSILLKAPKNQIANTN